MKADGTLLNFKQYAAFGETILDTLGVTRQGYIGKEKDVENGLGAPKLCHAGAFFMYFLKHICQYP